MENFHPHTHFVASLCLIAPEPKSALVVDAVFVACCGPDTPVKENEIVAPADDDVAVRTLVGRGGDACKVTNSAENRPPLRCLENGEKYTMV